MSLRAGRIVHAKRAGDYVVQLPRDDSDPELDARTRKEESGHLALVRRFVRA
jgi:hypothetical protein